MSPESQNTCRGCGKTFGEYHAKTCPFNCQGSKRVDRVQTRIDPVGVAREDTERPDEEALVNSNGKFTREPTREEALREIANKHPGLAVEESRGFAWRGFADELQKIARDALAVHEDAERLEEKWPRGTTRP